MQSLPVVVRFLFAVAFACLLCAGPAQAQCRPSDVPRLSPSPLRAWQAVPVFDAEPNNTAATANQAWLGTIANGAVYPNDIDFYAIDVPANTTLNLYAQVNYYGSPLWAKLTLYDRDGVTVLARQDSMSAPGSGPTDRGGRDAYLRYTIATGGRYFVAISDTNNTGTSTSWYSIKLFTLTPSPGDPVSTLADGFPYARLMTAAPGGLYVLQGSTIERVRLDGSRSVLATGLGAYDMAADGAGNILVTGCSSPANGAVWRISQDGTQSIFVDSLPGRVSLVTVGPDGDIWVCLEENLLRFDPAGGLRDTVITDYRIWYANDMAFAPNGDLLLASYDGVYKVQNGKLELVIPDGHFLISLAFDRDGDLYAGQSWGFPGGVTLFDPSYAILNDPVARVDSQATLFSIRSLAFGRNDDGTASRRLFALYASKWGDSSRVVELNPQGIRAAGASMAPPIGRITLDSLPHATAGGHYQAALHAADGTTGAWTLSTGSPPPGLTFNSSGEISGTAPHPGLYSFTVKRTNGDAVGYARVILHVNVGAPQDYVVWESEPNNTAGTANPIAMFDTISGSVSPATDQDWYAIDLTAGQQVHVAALSGTKLSATLTNDSLYPLADFRPQDNPDELDTNLWFKAPRSGRFYVYVSGTPPVAPTAYRLFVDSAPVMQGPGDPTRNFANVDTVAGMVAGKNELWVVVHNHIDRVDANGNVSPFPTTPTDLGQLTGGIALDASGNLLVVSQSVIWRIAPNGTSTQFARTSYNSPGITVGPDGDVWVGGSRVIRRFSAAGLLKDSVVTFNCTDITYLAFSPAGELHYAGGCDGLYKLVNGNRVPKQILYLLRRPQAPAFDRDGYLYLVNGFYMANGENSKVVLYDSAYHKSKDPFSTDIWHDRTLEQLVFWRDASGNTTDRLFAIGGGRIIELNHSGVRAPGWPIGQRSSAPNISVSVAAITAALMGGPSLTAEQVQYLDNLGNHNGKLDIGDLRAYVRSTHP